jgi:hypothetical protein
MNLRPSGHDPLETTPTTSISTRNSGLARFTCMKVLAGGSAIKTWFTLFFVPVFPHKTLTAALCPIYKYGLDG